jgi:hypothetical protein
MEKLIHEMYEDFIISKLASSHFAFDSEVESCGQDLLNYIVHMEHVNLCEQAESACKEYLQSKDILKLISSFKKLGLIENIFIIKKYYKKC